MRPSRPGASGRVGRLTAIADQDAHFDPVAPDRYRIGTCRALLDWVIDNVEDWSKGVSQDGSNLILTSIFVRSTRTYEGVVRCLCERGFGEQALMLDRSLFEDMIDAHWVALNRDLACERIGQHDLHSRLLKSETQRKHPAWFDNRKPPTIDVTPEELGGLRQLFGKYGGGSWTGAGTLRDRVQIVKPCWDERGQDTLVFWHAWVHRFMNEVLHPSAFSIARFGAPTIITGEGDKWQSVEWRLGSTPQWLSQALHAAFWTYSQTIGLLVDEFYPDAKGEFNERYRLGERAFRQADHWERLGRFEPLPSDEQDGQ